jgi:hypothetical protein
VRCSACATPAVSSNPKQTASDTRISKRFIISPLSSEHVPNDFASEPDKPGDYEARDKESRTRPESTRRGPRRFRRPRSKKPILRQKRSARSAIFAVQ